MKHFKNIIIISIFFITGTLSTKGIKPANVPVTPPYFAEATKGKQPYSAKSGVYPELVEGKGKQTSYAQALNTIKRMSPQQIIVNNRLTNEFINFVTSLNLSDIETEALLQAGAYAYAQWAQNNAQNQQIISDLKNQINRPTQKKPVTPQTTPQPKPIVSPKPTQEKQVKPKESMQPPIAPSSAESFGGRGKAFEGKQPSAPKKTMEPPHVIYNAILLLDPKKVETLDRYGNAMVGDALMGMYEQVAPIVMTSNILEIITIVRQRIGEKNL